MSAGHRAALSAILIVLAIAPVAALANGGHHHHHGHADRAAHHSLRQAVTDQDFYFVMADRFKNGSAANDNGGLPPGKTRASRASTPPARAGTTAATSWACRASSATSRASAPPRSG